MSKTISTYVKTVDEMRKHQRQWFKHKFQEDLTAAKKLEKKVDAMTESMKKVYP